MNLKELGNDQLEVTTNFQSIIKRELEAVSTVAVKDKNYILTLLESQLKVANMLKEEISKLTSFKKSDLKTGMVTIDRRGSVSRVLLYTESGSVLVQEDNTAMALLCNYDENLDYYPKGKRLKDCDIMEVYSEPLLYHGNLIDNLREEDLLYKRKEEE